MIRIQVRDNKVFHIGYPYNNDWDKLFETLNIAEYYKITEAELQSINAYKNKLLDFDKNLYETLNLIDKELLFFDNIRNKITEYDELLTKYNKNKELSTKLNKEIQSLRNYKDLYDEAKNDLLSDISEIDNIISDYEIKLGKTEETLDFNKEELIEIVSKKHKEIGILYEDLEKVSKDLEEAYKLLNETDYEAIILKEYMDEWVKKPEVYRYYIDLFKDEYYKFWTYGKALLFDEQMKNIKAKESLLSEIIDRLMEKINEKLRFEAIIKAIDKDNLTKKEFYTEMKLYYNQKVDELITEITELKSKLKRFINVKHIGKFKELVRLKYKDSMFGKQIITKYDDEIEQYRSEYKVYFKQITNNNYKQTEAYIKLDEKIKDYLSLQVEKLINNISISVTSKESNKKEIEQKIAFWEEKKNESKQKLIKINDKLDEYDRQIGAISNQIDLLKEENSKLKVQLEALSNYYFDIFNQKLSLFSNKNDINEQIIDIFEYKIKQYLTEDYEYLLKKDVLYIDKEAKKLLFEYYNDQIKSINEAFLDLLKQYLSQNIAYKIKVEYLKVYLNEKIKEFYALINYFYYQKEVNLDKIYAIKDQIVVKSNEYFALKDTIKLPLDYKDYENMLDFNKKTLNIHLDKLIISLKMLESEIIREKNSFISFEEIERFWSVL